MILEKVIYKLADTFINLKEPDEYYKEIPTDMLLVVQQEALETALLIEKYLHDNPVLETNRNGNPS